MNRRKIGESYEEAAGVYLQKKGIRLAEKNFRCRQGEVDLIGWDGEYLVFFEVKYRRTCDGGIDWNRKTKENMWCGGLLSLPKETGGKHSGTV